MAASDTPDSAVSDMFASFSVPGATLSDRSPDPSPRVLEPPSNIPLCPALNATQASNPPSSTIRALPPYITKRAAYPAFFPVSCDSIVEESANACLEKDGTEVLQANYDSLNTDSPFNSNPGFSITLYHTIRSQQQETIRSQQETITESQDEPSDVLQNHYNSDSGSTTDTRVLKELQAVQTPAAAAVATAQNTSRQPKVVVAVSPTKVMPEASSSDSSYSNQASPAAAATVQQSRGRTKQLSTAVTSTVQKSRGLSGALHCCDSDVESPEDMESDSETSTAGYVPNPALSLAQKVTVRPKPKAVGALQLKLLDCAQRQVEKARMRALSKERGHHDSDSGSNSDVQVNAGDSAVLASSSAPLISADVAEKLPPCISDSRSQQLAPVATWAAAHRKPSPEKSSSSSSKYALQRTAAAAEETEVQIELKSRCQFFKPLGGVTLRSLSGLKALKSSNSTRTAHQRAVDVSAAPQHAPISSLMSSKQKVTSSAVVQQSAVVLNSQMERCDAADCESRSISSTDSPDGSAENSPEKHGNSVALPRPFQDTHAHQDSSVLAQEPTKQLRDHYASDNESTTDQPLSLRQMHLLIRCQRSEMSLGGPGTENPLSPVLSAPHSGIAQTRTPNPNNQLGPLGPEFSTPTPQRSSATGTTRSSVQDALVSRSTRTSGDNQGLSPVLSALQCALADGSVMDADGVVPVHSFLRPVRAFTLPSAFRFERRNNQSIGSSHMHAAPNTNFSSPHKSGPFRTNRKAIIEGEEEALMNHSNELFSPLPDISQNFPSTPSWSAPDSILNTFSTCNEETATTPMTPTHENSKDTPFSTRSEYSNSRASGRFQSLLATPSTAGTSITSKSSLQTPRSGKNYSSAFSLLRHPWKSNDRQGKAATRGIVRQSGALRPQSVPLQNIIEEVEPNPYTTHGNPFFQAATSVMSPGRSTALSPVAPRMISFQPPSTGRTLSAAVAGAAALGAFDRSSPISPHGHGSSHPSTTKHFQSHSQHSQYHDATVHVTVTARRNGFSSKEKSLGQRTWGVTDAMHSLLRCATCARSQHATYSPRMEGPDDRHDACMNMYWSGRGNLLAKHAEFGSQSIAVSQVPQTATFGSGSIAVPSGLRTENDQAPLLHRSDGVSGNLAQAPEELRGGNAWGGFAQHVRAALGGSR